MAYSRRIRPINTRRSRLSRPLEYAVAAAFLIAVTVLAAVLAKVSPDTLAGTAIAVDGDSLKIGEMRFQVGFAIGAGRHQPERAGALHQAAEAQQVAPGVIRQPDAVQRFGAAQVRKPGGLTVLLQEIDGVGLFVERSYGPDGEPGATQRFVLRPRPEYW